MSASLPHLTGNRETVVTFNCSMSLRLVRKPQLVAGRGAGKPKVRGTGWAKGPSCDQDAFGLLIQRQALTPRTGLLEDVPVTFTGFPLQPSFLILELYLYCREFFDKEWAK